jgi:predicted S18 family serine protease
MKKLIVLFVFIALTVSAAFAQCPMCKASLNSGRNSKNKFERNVGDGINSGILFLMSVPYVLVAGAGFAFYKTALKKKSK